MSGFYQQIQQSNKSPYPNPQGYQSEGDDGWDSDEFEDTYENSEGYDCNGDFETSAGYHVQQQQENVMSQTVDVDDQGEGIYDMPDEDEPVIQKRPPPRSNMRAPAPQPMPTQPQRPHQRPTPSQPPSRNVAEEQPQLPAWQRSLMDKQKSHRQSVEKQRQNSVQQQRNIFEQQQDPRTNTPPLIRPKKPPIGNKPPITNKPPIFNKANQFNNFAPDPNNNKTNVNRISSSGRPATRPTPPQPVEQELYEVTNESQETYEIPGEENKKKPDKKVPNEDSGYNDDDDYIEPVEEMNQRGPPPLPGGHPPYSHQAFDAQETYEITDNYPPPIERIPAKPRGMPGQEFLNTLNRMGVGSSNINRNSLGKQPKSPHSISHPQVPPSNRPPIPLPPQEPAEENYEVAGANTATSPTPPPFSSRNVLTPPYRPAVPLPLPQEGGVEIYEIAGEAASQQKSPFSSHPPSRNGSVKSNCSMDEPPHTSMRDRPLPTPQDIQQEDYEVVTHSQNAQHPPRQNQQPQKKTSLTSGHQTTPSLLPRKNSPIPEYNPIHTIQQQDPGFNKGPAPMKRKTLSLNNFWLEGMERPLSHRERRASADLAATFAQFPTGPPIGTPPSHPQPFRGGPLKQETRSVNSAPIIPLGRIPVGSTKRKPLETRPQPEMPAPFANQPHQSATRSIPKTLPHQPARSSITFPQQLPAVPYQQPTSPHQPTMPQQQPRRPSNQDQKSTHPLSIYNWFRADMDRKSCEEALNQSKRTGAFIVRLSTKAGAPFSISIYHDNAVRNLQLLMKDTKMHLGSSAQGFDSVPELIGYHQKNEITLNSGGKVKLIKT